MGVCLSYVIEMLSVLLLQCCFEQYVAVRCDIPVSIILPPKEQISFNQALEQGRSAEILANLGAIDVEKSEASYKSDEITVHHQHVRMKLH